MPTATDPGTVRWFPGRLTDCAILTVAGLMAVGLLGLALPRTFAGLAGLAGDVVVQRLRQGEAVDGEALSLAIEGLRDRGFWHETGANHADLGLLSFTKAQQVPVGTAERERLLLQAETSLKRGLRLAPGNPGAWARLASVRVQRGDRVGAAAALRMSMLTGSITPAIMSSRLALGLYLLNDLDAETTDMLANQVRLTWVILPDAIVTIPATPQGQAFIQKALDKLTDKDISDFVQREERGR